MPDPKWWVCADPHFDHPAILTYNPETRPFANIDEMNETIVRNWNEDVGKKDFVIIIGDFAYRNVSKWAQRLNGKKYLILGNHDSINQESRKYFHKVCDCLEKRILGQKCFFFHYACLSWPDKPENSYMFHGHSHGRMFEDDNQRRCDVSMDIWGMRVVPIEVLFAKLRSKAPLPPFTEEDRKKMLARLEKTKIENLKLLEQYKLETF